MNITINLVSSENVCINYLGRPTCGKLTPTRSVFLENRDISSICVNNTAFRRKLPLFSAIQLYRFSLKMSRFFCVFLVEKKALYALCQRIYSYYIFFDSAQRQLELRRVGNQLPVLGKANSLCKIVKLCFACLLVKLRLSPSRVGPRDKDIPGFRNSGKSV